MGRAAFVRGQAYLALHDAPRAIGEFQKITRHPYRYVLKLVYPLSLVGLARAHSMNGDQSQAAKAYDAALAIWKDADPGLPLVEAARSERAALAGKSTESARVTPGDRSPAR
jgi:tetratricopeptide (TPR) repeat protein